MKILFFYQYFGTPRGSWSTRVYELCRRWVEAGHRVTVVTSPYEKSDITAKGFIHRQDVEGINLVIINASDSNRMPTWKRVIKALQFSLTASWFSLTLSYDVVICSSGPITIGIPGIIAHSIRRKKMIFEVRDLWPAGGIEMGKITSRWQIALALRFERWCYRSAGLIVTASPDQESHILERFPWLKTIVIPNASDTDLFGVSVDDTLPAWAEGMNIFSHIGSLGFIHNCKLLIEAARELDAKNVDSIIMVFIGEGRERGELEALASSYGLRNVRFLGLKPKNELPLWLQRSVATLFTTLNNPIQNSSSPNKVFDSLAAGTPVIQTTTGWISRLIDETGCGVNVPPENARALAEAMVTLAADPPRRKQLSQNASRVASSLFNRDRLAGEYLDAVIGAVRA